MKAPRLLGIAMLVAAGLTSRGILAQSPADAAVKEVRTAIDTARKEVDAYKTAGGAADAADHPAIKWDTALWGSASAIRAARPARWRRSKLFGCWVAPSCGTARTRGSRRSTPTIRPGSASRHCSTRKGSRGRTCHYTIDTLSHVRCGDHKPVNQVDSTADPRARLSTAGRPRRGDATLWKRRKPPPPERRSAEEADGLIYEIKHLSVGLPAPPVSGKPRNGTPPDHLGRAARQGDRARLLGHDLSGLHGGGSSTEVVPGEIREPGSRSRRSVSTSASSESTARSKKSR